MKPRAPRAPPGAARRAPAAWTATSRRARRASSRPRLAGTRQLVLGRLRDLSPSDHRRGRTSSCRPRQTCERCHFSGTYHGEVLRSVVEYGDDETNTRTVTNLQMHVGGGEGRLAAVRGIHWHANPGTRVEYIATDETRQTIPYVKVTAADGARPRVQGRRRNARAHRGRKAPPHGVHGLPQSLRASDAGDGRAGGQRSPGAERDSGDAAVRASRGGEGAHRQLPVGGRRRRRDRARAQGVLPDPAAADRDDAGAGRRPGDCDGAAAFTAAA